MPAEAGRLHIGSAFLHHLTDVTTIRRRFFQLMLLRQMPKLPVRDRIHGEVKGNLSWTKRN